MKVFLVGGAVRDQLLGLPVSDRDYVVVGSSPAEMIAQEFKPVGQDFPVFLHPKSQEEYALARTERKVAAGYTGFQFHTSPDVTLEQDLMRRDLTINAMAMDEAGTLYDPWQGQRDCEAGILRHVSPAFSEDPVRILRLARLAARFAPYYEAKGIRLTVAPETMALMRSMVSAGEVDALVPERIWQEIARGLMEARPSCMFDILRECGALQRILPELNALWGVPQPARYHPEIDTGLHIMMVVDYAAHHQFPLPVRFAALCHDFGKALSDPAKWPSHHGHEEAGIPRLIDVCERLRVPSECRDLAILTMREHGRVTHVFDMRASSLVDLLQRCDAWRRPERFMQILDACQCDHGGRLGLGEQAFPQADFLRQVFHAASQVNAGEIAQRCRSKENPPENLGEYIQEAIRSERINAVKQLKKIE